MVAYRAYTRSDRRSGDSRPVYTPYYCVGYRAVYVQRANQRTPESGQPSCHAGSGSAALLLVHILHNCTSQ